MRLHDGTTSLAMIGRRGRRVLERSEEGLDIPLILGNPISVEEVANRRRKLAHKLGRTLWAVPSAHALYNVREPLPRPRQSEGLDNLLLDSLPLFMSDSLVLHRSGVKLLLLSQVGPHSHCHIANLAAEAEGEGLDLLVLVSASRLGAGEW